VKTSLAVASRFGGVAPTLAEPPARAPRFLPSPGLLAPVTPRLTNSPPLNFTQAQKSPA